jgi:hypothetical protein
LAGGKITEVDTSAVSTGPADISSVPLDSFGSTLKLTANGSPALIFPGVTSTVTLISGRFSCSDTLTGIGIGDGSKIKSIDGKLANVVVASNDITGPTDIDSGITAMTLADNVVPTTVYFQLGTLNVTIGGTSGATSTTVALGAGDVLTIPSSVVLDNSNGTISLAADADAPAKIVLSAGGMLKTAGSDDGDEQTADADYTGTNAMIASGTNAFVSTQHGSLATSVPTAYASLSAGSSGDDNIEIIAGATQVGSITAATTFADAD